MYERTVVGLDGSAPARDASPVTVTLLEGDPEREVLRHAPDGSMLVVGRQEANPHLHRSTSSRLASRASVPVALVRTNPGRDRTEGFPSLTIWSHLGPGPATSALSRHAHTAAILVVGPCAHGPVKRFLLGPVSRALAETTDSPLVIATEGDRRPRLAPDRP